MKRRRMPNVLDSDHITPTRRASEDPRLRVGLVFLLIVQGVFLLTASPAHAQDSLDRLKKVILPGEVRQAAGRLAGVADLVRRSRWAEALDEYQRLISEVGDDLVPETSDAVSGSQRSIQLRRLCHLRIAALPPAALRVYRDRVEVQAEKWLQQGRADRDVRALRRVVEEAFCSRAGAQALNLLGDLAFEQGSFEEALSWWQMLARPPGAAAEWPGDQLVFPAPAIDLPQVIAKQILARIFEGDFEQAEAELKVFRQAYPGAAGQFGGRKGNYGDIVQALLEQARDGPSFPETLDWPTFGGAPARNRPLATAPPRRLWADGPAWRVRLDSGEVIKSQTDEKPAPAQNAFRFAVHPIIAGDKVLVADARQVLGFHLLTGKVLFRYKLQMEQPVGEPEVPAARRPSEQEEHYSLTAEKDRVYARLGASLLGPGKEGSKTEAGASYVVCLDLRQEDPGRERWRVPASAARGLPTVFEGAPLVHRGRVLIAQTSLVGIRAQTAIACYDAATGTMRWRQEVCDSPEYEDQPAARFRQHLLTLAGTQVVYCSHAGAVVAVDSLTGKRTWALRYPGRAPKTGEGEIPRAGAPCLYAGGCVFVAPADSDRVLCLDGQTGRVLWDRDGIEVVQLLGAAQGRLIFTTPRGIRALNAATGRDQGGWSQPDEGNLPGLGRGLLAGGWVFWPTQDPKSPLRAVSQEQGSQQRGEDALDPTQLHNLVAGNFALGGGCLVVAGAEELVGYVPPERFLKRHQQDAARPDAPASALYRLAQAEAGAGLYAQALKHFDQALLRGLTPPARKDGSASPPARDDGSAPLSGGRQPPELLPQHARAGRVALLAELRRKKTNATLLAALTGEQIPPSWDLPALVLLGDLWTRAGRPKEAVATWQAILRDQDLRQSVVTRTDGISQRGADFAARQIKALVKVHEPEPLPIGKPRPEPACGFLSSRPKELTLPIVRTWEAPAGRLVVPARSPQTPEDCEGLFFINGAQVACHNPATGVLRWRRALSFVPDWLGVHGDSILVGGAAGVQDLRLADGSPIWEFLTPPRGEGEGLLSGFQLTGSHLCFFQDARRLLALDVHTGEVAWSFWAPGAQLRPLSGGGRFHPNYHAGASWTILQTSGGSQLILASTTGQKFHQAQTTKAPWPQPPLLLDPEHVALVLDARLISRLDLATGKATWTYQPRAPTCLTGEPPQLFGTGDILCLLVPLSFGYQLERIDPATGKHLWPDVPRLCRTAFAGKTVAFDGSTLFYSVDQVLCARSLADGKRLWARPLPAPAGPWKVLSTRSAVAAYPVPLLPAVWNRVSRVPCFVPCGFTHLALPLPRASIAPTNAPSFRVQLHDPRDGQLVQRLVFATSQPWAGLEQFGRYLAVVADGKAWGLAGGD